MKKVREHIDEKFEQDSDPIRDMGIGIRKATAKQAAEILRQEIKKFGIKLDYKKIYDDKQCIEIFLEDEEGERLLEDYGINFYNDKDAKEDGVNPGWFIDGYPFLMKEPSYVISEVVVALLEAIFGYPKEIDKKIQYMKNAKEYIFKNS